jgi:6-phosphogluconate dehydrogenase
MQLIAEVYDVLKAAGGLGNAALQKCFEDWNKGELQSYLVEITAVILGKQDEDGAYVVDGILDQTGMKGTGRWTVQEAAEKSAPCPTMAAALDAR